MKGFLAKFALLSALAITVSFTGCKDYGDDITNVRTDVSGLKSRIEVLETFKTWTEGEINALKQLLAAPNGAIDELEARLAELEAAHEDALKLIGDNSTAIEELEQMIDQIVAQSTIVMGQIMSQLEDIAGTLEEHTEQIEELYELIEAIDGGDSYGTQIIAILQDIDLLEDEIDDIWVAIRNISTGGGGGDVYYGVTTEELNAALKQMMADLIQSVNFIAQTTDELEGLSWDELRDMGTEELVSAYVNASYLVAPKSMVKILCDKGTKLEGVVNKVASTATRAIMNNIDIPVEIVSIKETGYGKWKKPTGEITVSYDLTALKNYVNYEGVFQIALRISTKSGKEIVSNFVNLYLYDIDGPDWVYETVDLSPWANNIEDELTPVTTWAPDAEIPDGSDFLEFPEEGNLPLGLETEDTDWDGLVNPAIAYTEAFLYSWDATAEAWVKGAAVEINDDNELVMPAGEEGVYYRIIVSFEVTATNLTTPFQAQFGVELPFFKYVDEFTIAQVVEGEEVAIDEEGLTFTTDDEGFELVATGFDPADATNKNVTWASDNEEVVIVDEDGLVTIVGKGTATITATAVGGDPAEAAPIATVAIEIMQLVNEITIDLDPAELTLNVGDVSDPIEFTVSPDNANDITVTWESDDEDVATVAVDDVTGEVTITAVARGTATITATANDASGETATIAVTVNQPVTSITIPDALPLELGDDPVILEVIEVLPADANITSVTWSVTEGTAVTVDEETGEVTIVGAGTAKIVATATDGSDVVSNVCEVTVSLPSEIDNIIDIIDGFVPKLAGDDFFEPFAQAWNGRRVNGELVEAPYESGNGVVENVGFATFIDDNGDGVPDGVPVLNIEQQLEAAYNGAIDFTVTYTIEGQYGWQRSTSAVEENFQIQSDNLATIVNGAIVTNGTTYHSGQNPFGDRLVIEVVVEAAGDITIDPDTFYLCVQLP